MAGNTRSLNQQPQYLLQFRAPAQGVLRITVGPNESRTASPERQLPFSIVVEVLPLYRLSRVPFLSILLTTLLLVAIAQPVWAHAVLMQSTPKLNSTVKGPDVPIWLKFNVRVDGGRSRLHLMAPDGSPISLEDSSRPLQTSLIACHWA